MSKRRPTKKTRPDPSSKKVKFEQFTVSIIGMYHVLITPILNGDRIGIGPYRPSH